MKCVTGFLCGCPLTVQISSAHLCRCPLAPPPNDISPLHSFSACCKTSKGTDSQMQVCFVPGGAGIVAGVLPCTCIFLHEPLQFAAENFDCWLSALVAGTGHTLFICMSVRKQLEAAASWPPAWPLSYAPPRREEACRGLFAWSIQMF